MPRNETPRNETPRNEAMEQAPRLEQQPADGAREGEGQGRRRRRRGGRGGERGNRPERGSHEGFAAEASPGDAIESRAAELESARAPRHEPVDDSSHRDAPAHHEAVEERYDPQVHEHEPVAPEATQPATTTSMFTPPAAFRVVSEHDEAQDESQAHRPQRKRRHAEDQADEPQQLKLVETQVEAPVAAAEDDLPRRTKPRRRRSQAADNEPLKLVETQPGTQSPQDGATTP
jgi:ribonuclease E